MIPFLKNSWPEFKNNQTKHGTLQTNFLRGLFERWVYYRLSHKKLGWRVSCLKNKIWHIRIGAHPPVGSNPFKVYINKSVKCQNCKCMIKLRSIRMILHAFLTEEVQIEIPFLWEESNTLLFLWLFSWTLKNYEFFSHHKKQQHNTKSSAHW